VTLGVLWAAAFFLAIVRIPARAASVEYTSLNVVVKDAETGQPIFQARLTLQFRQPTRKLHHWISYSAKTNLQGRCKFTNIPKGTIHLVVTSERHQTFGKDFELERDNQVIEVTLRKPQPLL
jgi:hypothetical protein